MEDLAARAASEGESSTNGGESLNKREVMVLATLRDLFALSMIEEVKMTSSVFVVYYGALRYRRSSAFDVFCACFRFYDGAWVYPETSC